MDNSKNPSYILFVDGLGCNNKPLFSSQKDLAASLLKEPAFKQRKLDSMKAYINQVLKPAGEKYSRPFSQKLKDAIMAAVEKRLKPGKNMVEIKKYLNTAFDELKSDDNILLGPGRTVDEFIDQSKRASELFIITDKPAELFNTPTSNMLTNILAKRIGLLAAEEGENVIEARYTFLILDSHTIATDFWLNLFKHLRSNDLSNKDNDDAAKTKIIKANNDDKIRVHVWKPPFGHLPVCIFNPNSNETTGFVVVHRERPSNQGRHICELSSGLLQNIQRKIYDPYFLGMNTANESIKLDLKSLLKEVTATQIFIGE